MALFFDDPTNPRPPGLALTAKTNDRCSRGNDRVEKMVHQPVLTAFADFNEKLQDLSFILENSYISDLIFIKEIVIP